MAATQPNGGTPDDDQAAPPIAPKDDWLEEALAETFPASDPITPHQVD